MKNKNYIKVDFLVSFKNLSNLLRNRLFLFFLVLIIFISGCSTKANENIGCEQEEYVWQQRILNENKNLTIQNKELQSQVNQLKMDKIMTEYNLTKYWENYLWEENYYYFYPTGCENPKEIFTICTSGCDIEYKCNSNSMNPLFWCNAKLTLAKCGTYSIGDIVLINNQDKSFPYEFLIHSIIDIDKDGKVTTKGFNNNGVDSFKSTILTIRGKVIKIEY